MNGEAIAGLLKRDIARVAQAGALSGSAAGFAGLISAHGNASIAGETAAHWTWLLVAALPLGLALATAGELWRADGKAYSAQSAIALARILLVIGLLGGAGGVVLEFVVASYIPTLFSAWHLDVFAVRSSLVANYPWAAATGSLVATVAMAMLEAAVSRIKSG